MVGPESVLPGNAFPVVATSAVVSTVEKGRQEGHEAGPAEVASAKIPKCAFCGGGPDGEPPLDVLQKAAEVGRQAKGRARLRLAGELERREHRRRGCLGPLLGPLSEKVGLAGVWVHRECAIWSPEVRWLQRSGRGGACLCLETIPGHLPLLRGGWSPCLVSPQPG